MINVLFFARLKDQTGKSELSLDSSYAGNTVTQLQQRLIDQGLVALRDNSIKVALNQNFCAADAIINDGDEVAFMPPVTGG